MENKKSPTRTFFILHRETILEAPPRFELGIKVLQTFALPLGYGTILFNYSPKRMTPRGFEPLLPP